MVTIVLDSLRRKVRVSVVGEYPVSMMAFSTRLRVVNDTFSGVISARDTVAVDTPADRATSFIVAIIILSN
jgi:hypothetical protein